ncbi:MULTISPECIES: hypothetical protein [unclassified Crossiella]|uniref:hypothetical protein n=1 Tax=unclassified Crossiella TaxID=2620835 RepID=UPI001FFF7C9B|nr:MULTISPECIES: hypothetical protein [unclassified Crossiella]MCK2245398.1 hypothetical protein [Crossiella sp. S99.2]MCK2259015.1 hypothetical protein [Crossiella sp. S99.1]
MTDSLREDEPDVPTRIVSHFYDNLADAVESLEAAERLGLGVTVRNRVVLQGANDDSGEVLLEEWVVDVYDAPPLEEDEDDLPDEDDDEEIAAVPAGQATP